MCPLACHCYFCRDGYYEIAIYNDPIIASEAGHLFTMPMSPTWGILVHTCIIMYVKNVSFTHICHTLVTEICVHVMYSSTSLAPQCKASCIQYQFKLFLVCVYALSTRAQYLFVYLVSLQCPGIPTYILGQFHSKTRQKTNHLHQFFGSLKSIALVIMQELQPFHLCWLTHFNQGRKNNQPNRGQKQTTLSMPDHATCNVSQICLMK